MSRTIAFPILRARHFESPYEFIAVDTIELAEHETFDWGKAAMEALEKWEGVAASHFYNWHLRKEGKTDDDTLSAA